MTTYIAIDGRSGSGKTYLSKILAEKLNATVFHLDEYGNDFEPFVGIPKLLEALHRAEGTFVIFEGVGVFTDSFQILNPYNILVSIPDEIRKARVRGRDVPTANRSTGEWEQIFEIWDRAEHNYFTDTLYRKADLVVGEITNELDSEAIVAKILG